jgi:hypothetical protein
VSLGYSSVRVLLLKVAQGEMCVCEPEIGRVALVAQYAAQVVMASMEVIFVSMLTEVVCFSQVVAVHLV